MATINRAGQTAEALNRFLKIDRSKIDKENRTVPMAFSSEEPVERWGENEVLSHEKGAYDFSRIASGNHPLLLGHNEHDPESQIGVIESAQVDADGVGRCIARFGSSAKAQEIFQDVCDGIRQNVSVGYDRTGVVKQDKAKDNMTTTFYKWMPTHVAIVPVPADTKVGIGRGKNGGEIDNTQELNVEQIAQKLNPEEKQRMRILLKEDPNAGGGGAGTAEKPATRAEIQKELAARRKTIRDIGEGIISKKAYTKDVVEEVMREAEDNPDMSIGDFRAKVFEKAIGIEAPVTTMRAKGVPQKDIERYSILRGIQSCLATESHDPKDGIEREWSDEIKKACPGVEFGGFAVPFDAPVRNGKGISICRDDGSEDARMARDLTVGQFGQGGAFVPTLLELPVIEVLRNKQVLTRRGCISLGGLTSNISIPRQTAAATAYSLPEQGLVAVSNQAIDQISMLPHRISFQGRYSRQLLIQSAVDVEGFIRDDAMKVLALKADYLGIFGGGAADEPTGLINQPGISSITFGGAASFQNLVAMETALAALNADTGSMAYVTSAKSRGVLKSAAKNLNGATTVVQIAIWDGQNSEGDGMINGYTAACSNQILNNIMIFADFSSLIEGLFGGLDVIVDPYTQAGAATNVITMNMFIDYALRHAQSVCVSTDPANQ